MRRSEGKYVCFISFASPSWEKQREMLDSIRCAKRIQQAHIPTEKMVEKVLKRLMKK